MADAAPRHVLVVSGLDPSGGAGFVADVRVVERHGLRAVGAITALTEQDTSGVRAVHPVGADELRALLTTLLSDVEVHAVKLGMLATPAHAEAIGDALALTAAPVVWDPILLPTRGRVALFDGDLTRAIAALAPHVTVVTPNLDEARVLAVADADETDFLALGRAICARGLAHILVKGGHATDTADDVLVGTDGVIARLPGTRISLLEPVHGTGCSLSTALACRLALGDALPEAARAAKAFVAARLAAPVRAGRGRASVL